MDEELQAVAKAGYAVVINLALHDADYSLVDEAGWVHQLGMQYIHIPVIWDAPQLSDLEQFFAAMEQCQNKKVFVHCAANMRVSAFMALYRIIEQGWSQDEAFRKVYEIWDPESEPVWYRFIQDALPGLAR